METIVYATDYSKRSVAALKFAVEISKALSMRLVLTHVYELPAVLGTELIEVFPNLSKDSLNHEHKKLKEFYEQHIGGSFNETMIRFEPIDHTSITNGIITKIHEHQAFMVFVGTRGESKLRDIVMGGTAVGLLENAPCPVWTVPEDSIFTSLDSIVYATDFEKEDINAIHALAELAKIFKAKIKVVHVSNDKDKGDDSRIEWFKGLLSEKVLYEHIDYDRILSNNICDRLTTYIKETNADVLVMLKRNNKKGLKGWLHTDLVKKMQSYECVPLLMLNQKMEPMRSMKKSMMSGL
ncbi:universal stress protein [Flagellimonas profundi]|uniref:Universal stress protein n=1 Tax=Flagellimonas profundi TaxID=2915620 RepID=A0ABS3FCB0_9FLAO|nr:universal stress protein [Allomuricauda profundi]MBO0340345.1 universal stress protein [Allomuricauda profundi]